ncbi:hypothetical protein ACQ4PT_067728 [Festuca glaucescens]
MTRAASSATAAAALQLQCPLVVALKHRVYPSPVHVEVREERAVAGGACSLRLLCSLTTSFERHMVGGPGPVVNDKQDGPTDYKIPLDGVDLRNHDACRAAVLKLLSAMPGSTAMVDHGAGKWYEPVVRAAADDIVSQLQPVTRGEETRGYAVDVSLSIQESFRYVEPEALLLACEQAAIHSCRTPDEHCAVCMEPLPDPTDDRLAVRVDDKAFTLPSCRHTFHRRCIAAWFEKGSTCDMMYCLVDVEKKFENIARDIC